jgi:hypothetical protein
VAEEILVFFFERAWIGETAIQCLTLTYDTRQQGPILHLEKNTIGPMRKQKHLSKTRKPA